MFTNNFNNNFKKRKNISLKKKFVSLKDFKKEFYSFKKDFFKIKRICLFSNKFLCFY